MGLEPLVEDILDAGRKRADSIVAEARKERERTLSEARERASAITAARLAEARRAEAQMRARELAAAELEVRRARLQMERELLQAAAEGARRRIEALSGRESEALLEALLRKVPPGYRVYSAPRSEAFLRERLGPAYAGTISCLGGLAAESPDGSVRIDLTYDTLLSAAVERTMSEVHRLLFPEERGKGV